MAPKLHRLAAELGTAPSTNLHQGRRLIAVRTSTERGPNVEANENIEAEDSKKTDMQLGTV
jgi:hypothetical protein